MRRQRPFVVITAAALATWLLLCAVVGVIAVEGALHPGRLRLSAADTQQAERMAANDRAVLAEVTVNASDGEVLRAWSIRPVAGNGDAVILLHGQSDNRSGMLGPASMFLRHGYAVLLPDARAHGMSGGHLGTYGVLEADDVRRWFDWLKLSESPHCIDGLGDSMGGAELLRSLDVEQGFCAVVAESPFATFREAGYDRLGQQFSAGSWLGRSLLRPSFLFGVAYARLRYGIDFGKADPARAVAATHVPVMLIHGLADRNLPPRHSEMIKAGNPAAVLWEPLRADHCGASSAEPAEYERRVIGWFAGHNAR